MRVRRRNELGSSSGVFSSTSASFCWLLLLAAGLQAKTRLPGRESGFGHPEPASSPPAAFSSLRRARTIFARGASVCSDILVVGHLLKSTHAEASGTASRHKHRLDWAKRGATCYLVSAQRHGRCAPGPRRVIMSWSENVENGKRQHTAAAMAAEIHSDTRAKCKQDLIEGGLRCTIQQSRPRWRIETSNIPEGACNITECSVSSIKLREGRRVIHVHLPLRTPPIPKTHQRKEKLHLL